MSVEMEPLASFTDHHPDICYLQYETDRLSYITTEDAKFQYCKAKQTLEISRGNY